MLLELHYLLILWMRFKEINCFLILPLKRIFLVGLRFFSSPVIHWLFLLNWISELPRMIAVISNANFSLRRMLVEIKIMPRPCCLSNIKFCRIARLRLCLINSESIEEIFMRQVRRAERIYIIIMYCLRLPILLY